MVPFLEIGESILKVGYVYEFIQIIHMLDQSRLAYQ